MSKLLNLFGQRFGFWVVKKRGKNSKSDHTQWLCKCECGAEKLVTSNSLRSGNSTSCGCNNVPNLIGDKFNKLKEISLADHIDKNNRYWLCKCKCGEMLTLTTSQLRSGSFVCCKQDFKKTDIVGNIEIFVRTLMPYSKMSDFTKSARIVYDIDLVPILLIN